MLDCKEFASETFIWVKSYNKCTAESSHAVQSLEATTKQILNLKELWCPLREPTILLFPSEWRAGDVISAFPIHVKTYC